MYKKIRSIYKLSKIYRSFKSSNTICSYTPLRIWLEPTDKCNLACPLCINRTIPEETKGYMGWELFTKIIDQLEDQICDINLFHRGEPLLHEKIAEMVGYANSKGLTTRIHSNATTLDKALSEKLINSGLDYISFSFDGFDKQTYERNRVNADFEKTLNNIINFLKIKKEKRASKPFTVLQIIDSGLETDRKSKLSFLRLFTKLPLDKLSIRTPHNWAGGIKSKNYPKTKKPIVCTFPWYGLTIFHDGTVVPCCQDYMGKINLGNANKENILKIWNNSTIQKLRSDFSRRYYSLYPPCQNCDRIWRKSALGVPLEYIGTFLREARIRK